MWGEENGVPLDNMAVPCIVVNMVMATGLERKSMRKTALSVALWLVITFVPALF